MLIIMQIFYEVVWNIVNKQNSFVFQKLSYVM